MFDVLALIKVREGFSDGKEERNFTGRIIVTIIVTTIVTIIVTIIVIITTATYIITNR